MQVTEVAAREVGVEDFLTLHGNLEAGTKYLQSLLQQFPDGRLQDRLALALSGYLLGPSRVRAAQRLALALGYDPYRWKDSVESVFPLLEDAEYYRQVNASFIPGGEAVQYVNAILQRYELYTRYIPRELPAVHTARTHWPVLSVAEPTG
jgi:membrane-bound lytic murein transglycosylase MltF